MEREERDRIEKWLNSVDAAYIRNEMRGVEYIDYLKKIILLCEGEHDECQRCFKIFHHRDLSFGYCPLCHHDSLDDAEANEEAVREAYESRNK